MVENKRGRREPVIVRLVVFALVDSVEEVLKEERATARSRRTIESVVRDEVQSNLESVWYIRQVRVKPFRSEDTGHGTS